MKWLDNEQTQSVRNASPIIFKKTGFIVKSCFPYTNLDIDKNGENVPKLGSVEVVLVHCNLVKNDYQYTSKVLFTFVPNKNFEQLINISPRAFTMINTVNTKFSYVEVWFTNQSSKALEIEDYVNLTLIIG